MTGPAITARSLRLGAGLVALYLAVAALTTSWAPGGMRPLFDGFGSHPGQYNWVDPPGEFAEGNQRPEAATRDVLFDATGSTPTAAGPNDGQALASLPPGALAAHPPDTKAELALSPVDAGKLGPLPAGLRPEGNAYQVAIAYQPSGTMVAALDKPGSVGLTSAAPADTLLYSADGRAWETRQGQPLRQGNGLTGTLAAPGYYLAASQGPARAAGGGSGSGGTVVLVVVGLAVPLILAGLLISRRGAARSVKGRGAAGRARPGAARRPPASGSGSRGRSGASPAKGGKGGKAGKRPPPRRR